MSQLVLYLDPGTAARVDEAASRAGKSRSAWVRQVLEEKLSEPQGWSAEFLATYGSWEGESLGAIIRDARDRDFQPDREAIR